ncbi:MAG: hypothetical protein QOG44_2611 [Acidimicrobiaceae bacterium]|nr:hypothetical protein [Acidimicrobiaceae bacterium]
MTPTLGRDGIASWPTPPPTRRPKSPWRSSRSPRLRPPQSPRRRPVQQRSRSSSRWSRRVGKVAGPRGSSDPAKSNQRRIEPRPLRSERRNRRHRWDPATNLVRRRPCRRPPVPPGPRAMSGPGKHAHATAAVAAPTLSQLGRRNERPVENGPTGQVPPPSRSRRHPVIIRPAPPRLHHPHHHSPTRPRVPPPSHPHHHPPTRPRIPAPNYPHHHLPTRPRAPAPNHPHQHPPTKPRVPPPSRPRRYLPP